jgi:hypothetical protein
VFIGWLNFGDLERTYNKTLSYQKETIDIWVELTKKAVAEADFWKMQYDDVAQDSEDTIEEDEETTWH